jgi:hypothetical protein
MAFPYLLTYQDLVDHLIDFVGGSAEESTLRHVKGAIQSAYRELVSRPWSYYHTPGRIVTQAPYSTGTLEYDHTGGSVERKVTLTGGTWPAWAASGRLIIDGKLHSVATREDSAILTLDSVLNPGADIASGTSYSLVQDIYTLPNDYRAIKQIYTSENTVLEHISPDCWIDITTRYHTGGTPQAFTIMSDPDLYGVHAIFLDYYPSSALQLDYIYQRDARQLRYTGYGAGETSTTGYTSGVTGSAGFQTITGSSTAFTAQMVGSVIRLSGSTTVPTGLADSNPYTEQRIITAVASTTSLTVDSPLSYTYPGSGYTISDPVDIGTILIEPLLRSCERQLAIIRNMKSLSSIEAMYRQSRLRAMEADAHLQVPRSPGGYSSGYDRVTSPTLGDNVG